MTTTTKLNRDARIEIDFTDYGFYRVMIDRDPTPAGVNFSRHVGIYHASFSSARRVLRVLEGMVIAAERRLDGPVTLEEFRVEA